jgi:hypothetical protein
MEPKKVYPIVAHVSPENKQKFAHLASCEGISSAAILRKLIKSVLSGDLALIDIFRKNSGEIAGRAEIKTRLTEIEKRDFFNLSQKWDLMPGTLIRFLVNFYIGAPEKLYDCRFLETPLP